MNIFSDIDIQSFEETDRDIIILCTLWTLQTPLVKSIIIIWECSRYRISATLLSVAMKYDSPLDCRIAGTLLGWTRLIDSCCLQTVQYDAIKHICTFYYRGSWALLFAQYLWLWDFLWFVWECESEESWRKMVQKFHHVVPYDITSSQCRDTGEEVHYYTPLHQAHFGLGRTVLVWLWFAVLKTDLCSAWWVSRLARWSPVCVEDVTGSGNAAQLRRVLS